VLPEEVESVVVPGASFHWWWGEDNPNNHVVHVRAIVDGDEVVHREWWRKWGGHWHYDVRGMHWYHLVAKDGNLFLLPPSARKGRDVPQSQHTEDEDYAATR
jgi:hypothetical protein